MVHWGRRLYTFKWVNVKFALTIFVKNLDARTGLTALPWQNFKPYPDKISSISFSPRSCLAIYCTVHGSSEAYHRTNQSLNPSTPTLAQVLIFPHQHTIQQSFADILLFLKITFLEIQLSAQTTKGFSSSHL